MLLGNEEIDLEKDIYGSNLLHFAVIHNNTNMIKYLFYHPKFASFDLDAQNRNRRTALYYAAKMDNKEIAEFLLYIGANIHGSDEDGQNLIFTTVSHQGYKTIDLFLANGIDINEVDFSDSTPLHCAAKYDNKKAIEILLSRGIEVDAKDENKRTALSYTLRDPELIKILLSHGANINDVDIWNKTPLHYAAENCYREGVEFLLSNGADVNVKDNGDSTVLHYAVKAKEFSLSDLFGHKIDPVSLKYKLSHPHSSIEKKLIVEMLISHGVDINAKNHACRTALHYAVKLEPIQLVNLLLAHNADINIMDEKGDRALDFAILKRNKEII
ncbi:hypothetical protein TVAG_376460 [Trichomonas vaginalis G3]|uniref:Uncharacterized protein n=1 Tax=Trichomonas vaginalis (strain ATCC PRA-98 / G3) TaxID=412133 RepID=A2FU74_TRIV3|nr:spectrin binding [Trichomonas vaginalis G3]EAX91535.1 hypothetical protein TVAG_376460 [Trichomonas vaginalis G3]KAI5509560.1 spectrin binding [Trichomonas vaginalis G3]|eukprot:XP_001304465.1 hypothetical protein [Trichomonas vaginalis G3]